MEIKTYRTNNKAFPWTAEDTEGHSVNAKTKEAAINLLKTLYQLTPKIAEYQPSEDVFRLKDVKL